MNRNKIILILSFCLAVLTGITSYCGLFIPGFYSGETYNWQAQSIGQDLMDLFLVIPFLMITSWFIFLNNNKATLIWGGVIMYLLYSFLIYAFDVHFNRLFIIYCFTLGIAFYSFLYFLYMQLKDAGKWFVINTLPARVIGVYFIVISSLFYLLWLAEIIPSVKNNTTPVSIMEAGLPTNPVHVIDLSVFLPALFVTGVLLWRKVNFAYALVPAFLTFFILMTCTIGALVVMMKLSGVKADITLTYLMGFLTLLSAILLAWFNRNLKIARNGYQ